MDDIAITVLACVIAHDRDQVRSAPPLTSPRLDGGIRRQLQIHYGVPDPVL